MPTSSVRSKRCSRAEVEWAGAGELAAERDAFRKQIDAWRRDWESRDLNRYFAHYSPQFHSGKMDLAAWDAHKRKVAAGKNWIKVGLSNLSILRSPGRENLMILTFNQDYRSSNLSQQTRKRQYWLREGETWKIVYEAPIRSAAVTLPESFPGRRR